MTDKTPTSLPRRRFLRGVAAGGTLAAGAAAAGVRVSADTARADKPAGKDDAGRARGYQESEHVRRYYDLARF
ncbi:hypothetical protein [Arhodomonas sp. SL1]|uniref:hypothetical protein n=1 Tax=Arhodomonas sp. SL1 TaxID=3425691 RepID=UPI003F885EA8